MLPLTVPPLDTLRIEEHVHGHLGWISAVALVHPAILLRRTKRRADLAVGLSLVLISATGLLGVFLYTPYRDALRHSIFVDAPAVGYLFERKEHIALGAIGLAWAGAAAYVGAACLDGAPRDSLRRAAHWAFVASACFALVAAVLGTIVAIYKTF